MKKEIYQIPWEDSPQGITFAQLKTLRTVRVLCAMDIKSVLKHVSDDPKKVFDAGLLHIF